MVGKKLILMRKVKGSTIIEVVISMVVILLVFGIAMLIYGNIIHSSLSVSKVRAESLLEERLILIKQNPAEGNETIPAGDFQIEQEIQPYKGNAHLARVHLMVLDQNNAKSAELYQIIQVP